MQSAVGGALHGGAELSGYLETQSTEQGSEAFRTVCMHFLTSTRENFFSFIFVKDCSTNMFQ